MRKVQLDRELYPIIYTVALGLVVILLNWWSIRTKQDDSIIKLILQSLTVFFTALGTYFAAKVQLAKHSKEILRQRALLAKRRVETLSEQLIISVENIERQRRYLNSLPETDRDIQHINNALDNISTVDKLSYAPVNDILLDWKEIIPEEIDKLTGERRGQNTNE